jgi:carbonic anhydrase
MDLEMHIVHLYADGSLGGVIGIMFDRSAGEWGSEILDEVAEDFVDGADTEHQSYIDLHDFVEGLDGESFWSYKGSLTTPPCTEGINWTVLSKVQPISDV